jgi:hypothetical protein
MKRPNQSRADAHGKSKSHSCIHDAAPLTSDLHRVGGGFSVRFYLAAKHGAAITLGCEWHPHVPSPRDARRKVDLDRYRSARHQFLEAIAERLGGTVLCLERPGGEGAKT